MAFLDIRRDGTKTLTFYNVFAGVGYGCPNHNEDVKVVQFFLQRIYSRPKYQKFKPWGEMVVDGKCGPITNTWIRKFQSDGLKHGVNVLVDGIIDKAGNETGNFYGSYSGTIYTIRILNDMMYINDGEVYKNLTNHPEVPQDVRLIFQQIQAEGPPLVYLGPNDAV